MDIKNVTNVARMHEFENEFVKIYNDSYELDSNLSEDDAIQICIVDFTKFVKLDDLSLFWMNFISEYQLNEYKALKNIQPLLADTNIVIFDIPHVLIGWQKKIDTPSDVKYYWLRLIDNKPNVIITDNIGDFMYTSNRQGVFVVLESDDSEEVRGQNFMEVGRGLYYLLTKGLAYVFEKVSTNTTSMFFNGYILKNLDATINCVESVPTRSSEDIVYEFLCVPICSDDMDTNIVMSSVVMLHELLRLMKQEKRKYIHKLVRADESTIVVIGYQNIDLKTQLVYTLKNVAGILTISVYFYDSKRHASWRDAELFSVRMLSSTSDTTESEIYVNGAIEADLLHMFTSGQIRHTSE